MNPNLYLPSNLPRRACRANSKGFSLLELLLVVGVISVLVAASFYAYNTVKLSQQAKTEIDNFNNLYANLNVFMDSTRGKPTISMSTANKRALFTSGVFPRKMRYDVSSVNFITGWGTQSSITNNTNCDSQFSDSPTGRKVQFSLRYTDMPVAICYRLLPAIASRVAGVKIGGSCFAAASYPGPEFASALVDGGLGCKSSEGATVDIYF